MEKMKGVAPKKNTPALVAGNADVVKEARKMRKSGGSAQSSSMDEAARNKYGQAMGRKRGGKAMKDMGKMGGKMAAMRADRKPRKSGGICSADWSAAQGEGQKPRG